MPRVYVLRAFVIIVVFAGADLADGESMFTEGAVVFSLFIANVWLAANILGWVLARVARSAPVVDTVMMQWVVPHVCAFQLVRKSRSRIEAVEAERREELRRHGRL